MNDIAPMRTLDPAAAPISPAKFAHFVLRTGQFDRMIEWYRTCLRRASCFATTTCVFCPMTTSTIGWH
jgi:hypothetical protein